MTQHKIFLFFFIFLFPWSGFCQDLSKYSSRQVKMFESVRHQYTNRDYQTAWNSANELIAKYPDFTEAYLLKSDILHEMKQSKDEIDCLYQVLKIDSIGYPKVYFLLASVQKQIGEYEQAKKSFTRFISHAGNLNKLVPKAEKGIDDCNFAIALKKNPVNFLPERMSDSINTKWDEYWPSFSIDGKTLVFTRLVPYVDSLSGHSFMQEDFYSSESCNGNWSMARPIKTLNTTNNEGAQSISSDADLLFFTACSRPDSWGGCDLYFSRKEGGNWEIPQNAGVPVNSSGWEAQPSVSANNEYLYFVSNRKGGKGGMDIWRCKIISIDGTQIKWGKPENLGDSINTPGNEMSPYIHPDGRTLYFVSDYWPGMGGDDIFYSRLKSDSIWSKARNIGYPINTFRDERGLVVDASGREAYYSSSITGNMDIYKFEMPENIRPLPVTYALGTVVDEQMQKPLKAKVELIEIADADKKVLVETNGGGQFLIGLPLGKDYMLNVSAPGYLFYSEHFALKDMKKACDPLSLKIGLKPIVSGETVVLKNVFFETNSSQILSSSIPELNKLVQFLTENPNAKIEIGGHTDNVGSEEYNMELSTRRAEAVALFLESNGISKDRLVSRGYGFSVPVEDNDSEEGRAANRRTEFKIE